MLSLEVFENFVFFIISEGSREELIKKNLGSNILIQKRFKTNFYYSVISNRGLIQIFLILYCLCAE